MTGSTFWVGSREDKGGVGSITSRCLENEPALLPQTDFLVLGEDRGTGGNRAYFLGFEHSLYNRNILFLKSDRANYVSVSFLSDVQDVAFKALLTIQVNKFLFDEEICG